MSLAGISSKHGAFWALWCPSSCLIDYPCKTGRTWCHLPSTPWADSGWWLLRRSQCLWVKWEGKLSPQQASSFSFMDDLAGRALSLSVRGKEDSSQRLSQAVECPQTIRWNKTSMALTAPVSCDTMSQSFQTEDTSVVTAAHCDLKRDIFPPHAFEAHMAPNFFRLQGCPTGCGKANTGRRHAVSLSQGFSSTWHKNSASTWETSGGILPPEMEPFLYSRWRHHRVERDQPHKRPKL